MAAVWTLISGERLPDGRIRIQVREKDDAAGIDRAYDEVGANVQDILAALRAKVRVIRQNDVSRAAIQTALDSFEPTI